MGTINFPSSPTSGQTYTLGIKVWEYDGVKWGVDLTADEAVPWVRNSQWLTLPTLTDSDHKFVGLYAIYPEGNFVALTAAGNFNVDWGDGTNENVNSGVTAERNIAYTNASTTSDVGIGEAIACTFTDAGDIVNLTAHGWLDGQRVAFSTVTSTTGISTYITYYIVNKTADTFQVSSTIGGAALTLTTNGSGSVYIPQYRQVIITITMQGGQTFTSLNLQKKHSQSGLSKHSAPWLDIAIAGTSLSTLTISVSTSTIGIYDLEQVKLYANVVTSFNQMFYNCYALASLPVFTTSSGTSFSYMFYSCYSLVIMPLINTSAGTDFSSMFSNCRSLIEVPLLNTILGTYFDSMFSGCYSLSEVPLLNTAAGLSFSYMFSDCLSLVLVPPLNTASGTDFSGMFYGCESLSRAPLLNTGSSAEDFSYMFGNCYSLVYVPPINTVAGTNFSNMFSYCSSLRSIPMLYTQDGTDFSYMFQYCTALVEVPLLNLSAGLYFTNMFSSCNSLIEVPQFDTSLGTSFSAMFASCFSLVRVPKFNTVAGTNFSTMFSNCYKLDTVPFFNTAAGSNFGSMFAECRSLVEIPRLLVYSSSVNGLASMFSGCVSLSKGTLGGANMTHSYSGCKLSAAALDEIYTNLATVTSKTITVTNNYGNTSDTPSIATGKGWTVTG